jgi:hypothetical protein
MACLWMGLGLAQPPAARFSSRWRPPPYRVTSCCQSSSGSGTSPPVTCQTGDGDEDVDAESMGQGGEGKGSDEMGLGPLVTTAAVQQSQARHNRHRGHSLLRFGTDEGG